MYKIIYIILILLILYYLVAKCKNIEGAFPMLGCRNQVNSCLGLDEAACRKSWTKLYGENVKCSMFISPIFPEKLNECTPDTSSCDGKCQCSNKPIALQSCSDCIDCNNRGIASGIIGKCSCACKDGWSGNKCQYEPDSPLIPEKIKRLRWTKGDEPYNSIVLDKNYTSRLTFTIDKDTKDCQYSAWPIYPISSWHKPNYRHIPAIYNLAQFGFESIDLSKRPYEPGNLYKYRIWVSMNLTKDNMPSIHWYSITTFMFTFYVRTFFNKQVFISKKPCDKWEGSLEVTKALGKDKIDFYGFVNFGVAGNQCPEIDHIDTPHLQKISCEGSLPTKDFCVFKGGKILNSCHNKCSGDSDNQDINLYLELYKIDIKLR